MLTAAFTGTLSKLFLKLGCSEVKVVGLPLLLDALSEENRVGRGLITGASMFLFSSSSSVE